MKHQKNGACDEATKQKGRHIVTWNRQEDDILREQIRIHGTENWTIIASKYSDKTTRQCRRRWYTYLNSDFKKGGWSPEEDMILFEAQKTFGNRWTEIAKVVSGRTDNAVKNRFSTLCKKRAKHEALAKENSTPYIGKNQRVFCENVKNSIINSDVNPPLKRIRHVDRLNNEDNALKGCERIRCPFSVLCQNSNKIDKFEHQVHGVNLQDAPKDAARCKKTQGTFLKKDDPRKTALMQQAELLTSLAVKVNKENTDQSLENAWKILQDFLNQRNESDVLKMGFSDMEFQLEDFKDLVDDLRSSNNGVYQESTSSSECSYVDATQDEFFGINQNQNDDKEFSSPLQVTPLFKSLAEGIPTPKFSESERHFLLKTLGMESPPPKRTTDPHCKRSLFGNIL